MTSTDPFAVLEALAPVVPPDADALFLARVACDTARESAAPSAPGDARPPSRRVRWLAAAAVVGGVSATALLWPATSDSADASWTPTAVPATSAQVGVAQERCDHVLAGSAAQIAAIRAKGVPVPGSPESLADLDGRTVVLAEQRGYFTFVLSTNASWAIGCLVAPTVSDNLDGAELTRLSDYPAGPTAQSIDWLGGGGEGVPGVISITDAYGRAGSAVVGVDVTTVDGRVVHATVSGGYWSAWWPQDEEQTGGAAVAVHLADGTTAEAGTLSALDHRLTSGG